MMTAIEQPVDVSIGVKEVENTVWKRGRHIPIL